MNAEEIKDLNEIVTMYPNYAERQARQRNSLHTFCVPVVGEGVSFKDCALVMA